MRAILAVLAAALCFSTTGTARALAEVDASALAVGAARILVGGGILGLLAVLRRAGSGGWRAGNVRRRGRGWPLIVVGALGVLAYQPAFFFGTETNGVAIGTVVALGSAPIVTGVIDSLLTRKKPEARWLAATALAIVGVVMVCGLLDPRQLVAVNLLGIAASVGAGAAYAVYALASKAVIARSWEPLDTMGAVFATAAVFSLPVLLLAGTAWLGTTQGLALAAWLGVVTTAVAYLLFGWGLSRLPVTTVSTLTLAEPMTATLLGLIVLREQLTAVSVVGIIAIAAGVVLLSLPGGKVTVDVPAAT